MPNPDVNLFAKTEVKHLDKLYSGMIDWLYRTQVSEGIPFPYLVPREELLPLESVRFFHVDRNWLNAMADGALSVARGGTDEASLGTNWYSIILNSMVGKELGETQQDVSWQVEPMSGLLLRSRAVRDWPGMEISAFSDTEFNNRIRTIRQVKLSDNIMLCLFSGIPKSVRIQEPREGLRLGFDAPTSASAPHQYNSQFFDETDGTLTAENPYSVPSRSCSDDNSVLFIQGVFNQAVQRHTNSDFDSTLVAMQLMQFPYQQDFCGLGDSPSSPTGTTSSTNPSTTGTKSASSKNQSQKKSKGSWFGFGKK
jgi:hypothetical protein